MNDSPKDVSQKAFIDFARQLYHQQAKGFISDSEKGKIFSFETYLREMEHPADVISAWCDLAKKYNYLETMAKKLKRYHWPSNIKVLGKMTLWILAATICTYVLIAAFLLLFGVSLWHWKTFISFVLAGPVLLLVYLIVLYMKALKKRGRGNGKDKQTLLFIIKYFDNDELTFARAKSRLFVEK
jgi:hypothetical protein